MPAASNFTILGAEIIFNWSRTSYHCDQDSSTFTLPWTQLVMVKCTLFIMPITDNYGSVFPSVLSSRERGGYHSLSSVNCSHFLVSGNLSPMARLFSKPLIIHRSVTKQDRLSSNSSLEQSHVVFRWITLIFHSCSITVSPIHFIVN